MADDPLHELLTSPLEPVQRSSRRARDGGTSGPTRTGGPWLVVAMVAGAAIVFAGYLLADENTPVPTSLATTTTMTLAESGPGFPDGFTPIDGHMAIRVVRVLIRGDATFVTMSTVFADTVDTETSVGFPGGRWDLVLTDGRRITSTFEGVDALSRGYVSVRFEVTGIAADDIASVALTGLAERLSNVVDTSQAADPVTLPEDGSEMVIIPATTRFDLDAGVALVIDEFALSTTGGRLLWSLDGDDTDAVAAVFPTLTLSNGGDLDQFSITRIDPGEFRFSFATLGLGLSPSTRAGAAYFDPQQGATFTGGVPMTTNLEMEVAWVVFGPADVTLPVDTASFTVAAG